MRGCSKKQNILYITAVGVIIVYCFFMMLYKDNLTNSNIGYGLINSIFEGNFREFYNSLDWSYGMTIYIIYAIWSIPVWVILHITNAQVDMLSIPVLLWYKLLLVSFSVFSVWLVGKIAEVMYKEEKREVQIHYISSIFFIFPIFSIAQCDVIGLCFVLLGIYFYIQNKNVKFILCFAVAITMKYFALFVFIPLILFKYRKISKMFSVLIAGIGLMMISLIIIGNSDMGNAMLHNEKFYVNQHIVAFSQMAIQLDENRSIGLFGLFYMLLCIVAYIVPNQNEEKNKQYIIWLAFTGYMCFFLFYQCNIYWYILLAPFMILVSYFKKENLKINLLLEIVFSLLIVIYHSYLQPWVLLGEETYNYLFFKDLGQAVEKNSIIYVMENIAHIDLQMYMPLVMGIAYACAMTLIIINFPGISFKIEGQQEEELVKEIKVIAWLRVSILAALIMISIFCLLDSQKDYYLTDNADVQIVDAEIYEERCSLQGDLFFVEDGAWMNEECTIKFNLERKCNQDIKLSTYGYTVTGEDSVEVYVNSQYVGDLQKEDKATNITNRYIVIPNKYFSKDVVEQTILLKAKPHKIEIGDIVENGEVVGKDVRMLSIYIQSINLGIIK